MPELTPDELAEMLAKVDAVCQQAQELSAAIKSKMVEAKRGDYPTRGAKRHDGVADARKKR